MSSRLQQTTDAIRALQACGLARGEFRVQTERRVRGGVFVGYGDAQITLLCSKERTTEVLQQLVQHFRVTRYVEGERVRGYSVEEAHGKPGLSTVDISPRKGERTDGNILQE